MKKLGYLFALLIILSACTAGPAQKPVADAPVAGPGLEQQSQGEATISLSQTSPKSVSDPSGSESSTHQTTAVESTVLSGQPSSASVELVNAADGSPVTLAISQSGEAKTPFQLQLEEVIRQRKAAGLPVPSSVEFGYQANSEDAMQRFASAATMPGDPIRIVSKTVIRFDNPQQAGYTEWPPLIINKTASPEAQPVAQIDLTEEYRSFMETRSPGIWEMYEFGQEPRTHSIIETFDVNYPEQSSTSVAPGLGAQMASTEDILMGFTYTGPNIDLSIEDSLDVLGVEVYDFKAGVDLDWAFGLRLPARAELNGPDQIVMGSPFEIESVLTPLDWSATNYSSFGVASEQGNEFVTRVNFFVGVKGEVVGQDLCKLIFGVQCYLELDEDYSKSFVTPFGAGNAYPVIDISKTFPIIDLGLISWDVSLMSQPKFGSDKIVAQWQATGVASGSGQIVFSSPGSPVALEPISACDSGPAQVELTDFEYYFTQFLVDLTAKNTVTLHTGIFGDFSWVEKKSFGVDLSSIFGSLDLKAGSHVECDALFNCTAKGPDNKLALSIPVVDLTPPVTSLTATGTAGNHGWYTSDVQVSLSATDLPAGCGPNVKQTEYSLDGVGWNIYSSPFMINAEGITTVHYRSTDDDGNVEPTNTQAIKIDKTPPTITGAATTVPNGYGWYNTDVLVHFAAADAVSGIDTVTPDQTLSGEGANQSVTGVAVDMAGLTTSFTVTGINIDKTQPNLAITSPEARVYENTETFNMVWSASDGLSGMASENGTMDGVAVTNGQLIDLLILVPGPHTVTVEVTDKAGNMTGASVAFSVSVDADGLLAALEHMCELGWIEKNGICNSLAAKLEASIKSVEKGNLNAAENQLNAFLNELEAQKDKSINETAYQVLQSGAIFVIDHLH